MRDAFTPKAAATDAPRLLKNPKIGCPDVWIRFPRRKWPNAKSNIEDPVVPLERKFTWSSNSQIVVGKTIRGSLLGTWMTKKYQIGNACLFIENKGHFCQYAWR